MSSKKQLGQIIAQSSLIQQDKELWDKFIEVNNEEIINDVYEVMKDDVGSVEFFTKNLKDKLDAFTSKDSAQLNKIVDEEVEMVKNPDNK